MEESLSHLPIIRRQLLCDIIPKFNQVAVLCVLCEISVVILLNMKNAFGKGLQYLNEICNEKINLRCETLFYDQERLWPFLNSFYLP